MMLLGQGRAHHDVYTSTRHTAPKTTSNLQLRAALLQRSRASVIGHMWIDGDGHAADGAQEARGLLLGKKARMDAIPELEIVHDVVKASHAVGISQLDEEQLWGLAHYVSSLARMRNTEEAFALKKKLLEQN